MIMMNIRMWLIAVGHIAGKHTLTLRKKQHYDRDVDDANDNDDQQFRMLDTFIVVQLKRSHASYA